MKQSMFPGRSRCAAPLARRLMVVTMLATSAALLFSSAGIIVHSQMQARDELVERMNTTARIVGDNTSAALSFDDVATAEDTLRSLYALDEIALAALYDRAGKLFAVYRSETARGDAPPQEPEATGHRFTSDALWVFRDVILAGERVGTLHLRVSLDGIRSHLRRGLAQELGATLLALLLAWALAIRLTRAVSGPLVHLSHVVHAVAAERNYGLRAVKRSDDELGQLIDSFNEMLSRIEAHDAALQESRGGLERRVQEQAQALEQEVAQRRRAETELTQAQRRLGEASRHAAQAKAITDTLHGVRDLLGSVTLSANLVAESLQNSRIARIAQLARMLQEHEADLVAFMAQDPRGKQLPAQLAQVAEHLKLEHDGAVRELKLLRLHIEHINDLVAREYAQHG